MTIRVMTQEDIPAVEIIEQACFSQPWSEKGFSDALCNADAIFLVAEEAAEVLGYAGMYVSVDEGEITNVAVGAPFRGRGVGKALMEAMCGYAKKHSLASIILEVRAGNAGAIALYTNCGFVRIGTRRGFYEFPKEDADIMMWSNPDCASAAATGQSVDG
jgi:ribosomal-protein-alanine N-acetyltransferase